MMFEGFGRVMLATVGNLGLASAVLFIAGYRRKQRHNDQSVWIAAVVLSCLTGWMLVSSGGLLGFVVTILFSYAVYWTYPVTFVIAAGLLIWGIRKRYFWLQFAGFFIASLIAVYAMDGRHWRLRTTCLVIFIIWFIALVVFVRDSRLSIYLSLSEAIRARIAPLGGVKLEPPVREAIREPPQKTED
ncbi:MAG: hypothetical protein LBU53_01415 [Zoogloeaceae bacterium]|jgi:hypothetical protein|nr:hypothetical protein [Zoogloeaceae bacterium]